MINGTQVSALWFNNDNTKIVLVVDFDITVNTTDRFVNADITCEVDINDENPVFNFFVQRLSGDINLTVKDNSLNTRRTIKFEKAIVYSYLEFYDSQQLAAENRNLYCIEFSIHAESVNLGNASFSPAA
jgi:hypothetical protein